MKKQTFSRPISLSRSQFQANSLKVLKRSENHNTPVLVTKYGLPTHILVPLDVNRAAQCEQIPVEQYLDDVFAQFGQEGQIEDAQE